MLSAMGPESAKYYRISQNEYLLVAVEKFKMDPQGANKFIVNKMFQNSLAADITQIAKSEFKSSQKIKIDKKAI